MFLQIAQPLIEFLCDFPIDSTIDHNPCCYNILAFLFEILNWRCIVSSSCFYINILWLVYAWSSQIIPTQTRLTLLFPLLFGLTTVALTPEPAVLNSSDFIFLPPSILWLTSLFVSQKLRAPHCPVVF